MKFIRFLLILGALFQTTLAWSENANPPEYEKAAECYHKVKALPEESQSRAKWHQCVTLFEQFVRQYPKSPKAADALYSSGLAYRHLFEATKNEEDAGEAINQFNGLVKGYPNNPLADDALFNIGTLKWEIFKDKKGAVRAMQNIVHWHADGDMKSEAEVYLNRLGGSVAKEDFIKGPRTRLKPAKVKQIEKISAKEGEVIRVHLTKPVSFKESYSKHELENFRTYNMELDNAVLSKTIETGYSFVGSGAIRDITPAQTDQNRASIKFVIKKGSVCTTAPQKSYLEVSCGAEKKVAQKKPTPQDSSTPTPRLSSGQAPKQSSTPTEVTPPPEPPGNLSIVIDAGHGGKDEGAKGEGGAREKDVVLQIAKRLGWQLRNKLNAEVNYTRIEDRTLSLDDRNKITNGFNPDLFISIHANSAESKSLTGYQTFYLNNATDEASKRLAAIENAATHKNADDLEKIILTMMQNLNTEESRLLAEAIHKKVLSKMSRYGLKDRKVKSALFYVLVGAKCPAVLVETSFISNPEEEKKLKDPEYQETIAKAVSEGIQDYLIRLKSVNANL